VDRKASIRQYKESRRPMGVWRVHNTVADRSLLGSSVDLPSMLNRQQSQLRFGGHPCRQLQEDWNRLGPAAFVFEVLDTLKPVDESGYDPAEDLRVLLDLWKERLGTSGYRVP